MLGSNVPQTEFLSSCFKYGDDWGCECIQIMLTQSKGWHVPKLSTEKAKKFEKVWSESSVKQVVAHLPFLINLASPDVKIWERSVKRLIDEISYAKALGVRFLILHPGSYVKSTKIQGIQKIILALKNIFKNVEVGSMKILLETMAGQGTNLGSSLEELQGILNGVGNTESMGICLDTAHVFQSGYNLIGHQRYDDFMNLFDNIIGIDKISVIHLNDSKTKIGSRVDRHACIGKGEIGLKLFHSILKDENFEKTPKILELLDTEKARMSLTLLRKLQEKDKISGTKKRQIQLSIQDRY